MTYTVYWINPVAEVHVASEPSSGNFYVTEGVSMAGWGATHVWEGFWEFGSPNPGVTRLWRCQKATVSYLRMSQRNDAQGYTQPHARMQLNENRSSAATTGMRIFGLGGNASDPPAV